jgi:hypothetical protein
MIIVVLLNEMTSMNELGVRASFYVNEAELFEKDKN